MAVKVNQLIVGQIFPFELHGANFDYFFVLESIANQQLILQNRSFFFDTVKM